MLVLSACVAGCATVDVRPGDAYRQSSAYLYGRFYITGQNMSFEIRCRGGVTYEITFSPRDEVQMIAVPPSTCQLDQILYGGVVQKMASFRLLRNEILDPGGVYYVGDFSMSGTYKLTVWTPWYTEHRSTWRTEGIHDNYQATTQAMKQRFPQFAAVATENRVTH